MPPLMALKQTFRDILFKHESFSSLYSKRLQDPKHVSLIKFD
jgi:hypothetical protein